MHSPTERSRILLIYTGGTIGMVLDPETGQLNPFSFDSLLDHIPELKSIEADIETTQLSRIIDSSDMHPALWQEMARIIEAEQERYDGFVILHGTDTLAYTASALSFMVQDLGKPIVMTGSQLPIGMIRTDGKENLITAIQIAADHRDGVPIVQEVAVYFEYRLMRGNRVMKYSSEHFDAFHSPNYPALAEAGIEIDYDLPMLRRAVQGKPPTFHHGLMENVAVLKLFPGMTKQGVECILTSGAKGIVMESYGAGNGPRAAWFIDALKAAVDSGVTILNVTQCLAGAVEHGRYATSAKFDEIGVISGGDMGFETAVCKLMHVLARTSEAEEIKALLSKEMCGEMG